MGVQTRSDIGGCSMFQGHPSLFVKPSWLALLVDNKVIDIYLIIKAPYLMYHVTHQPTLTLLSLVNGQFSVV